MRWLTFLCCVAAGLGQSGRGTISGRVLDQDQAVAGAPIEAKHIQTGTVYKASSFLNGRYSIEEVPSGKYEVTISVGGFEKKETTVQSAQTSSVDFRFQPDFQLRTLVSCPSGSCNKFWRVGGAGALCVAGNAGQDLVGGLGPNERRGIFIVDLDKFTDGGLQILHAAEHASSNSFVGQFRKPAFDQVNP
jgi:hypothetical protein